jgi:hypothetical protein
MSMPDPLMPHSSEMLVAVAATVMVAIGLLRKFLLDTMASPMPADPWSAEVELQMESDNALPLCPRCLEAHQPSAVFCPTCGNPVSEFATIFPLESYWSLGDVLRTGTSGRFHVSPLTVLGYTLMPLAFTTLLAPFYWYQMSQNIGRNRQLEAESLARLRDEEPPPTARRS